MKIPTQLDNPNPNPPPYIKDGSGTADSSTESQLDESGKGSIPSNASSKTSTEMDVDMKSHPTSEMHETENAEVDFDIFSTSSVGQGGGGVRTPSAYSTGSESGSDDGLLRDMDELEPGLPSYDETVGSRENGDECCEITGTPAVWVVSTYISGKNGKKVDVRLSALAAGCLVKEGRVRSEDLVLYEEERARRSTSLGPTDPISGVFIAAHDVVGGVLHGLADYPLELRNSMHSNTNPDQNNNASSSTNRAATFAKEFSPTNPEGPKGVSRIIGTALKAPMEVTMNVSRGFENLPSLWGDDGREKSEVKGVVSGLGVAGKGFGLGLYDGITGLVTQPFNGVVEGKKEGGGVWGGVLGGLKGFGKGIGGVVCRPAAGAVGLPAYAFKGVYEEIKGKHLRYSLHAEGEKGWERMGREEREEVVRKWDDLAQGRSESGSGKYA